MTTPPRPPYSQPRLPQRHRRWMIAAASLGLVIAGATQIPRGLDHPGEPALLARGELATSDVAGASPVTAAAQAEIDRVVAEGQLSARARLSTAGWARVASRCAEFEGQRYCLGTGWTLSSPDQVAARLTSEVQASARRAPAEQTGDLSAQAALRQYARLTPEQRAARDRQELIEAARSVAKIWLLRHEIEGTALPRGFAAAHPEALAGSVRARTAGSSTIKKWSAYPTRAAILNPKRVRQQQEYWWCGPATMQMITWAYHDKKRYQKYWAAKLGTTSDGTAITSMVRVVNRFTGYGSSDYAGRYIALDISDYSFQRWYKLMMRHIVDYRAPVILHPSLKKQYYSYLDDDAQGHFQVGRAYDKNKGGVPLLGYFEPWNQQKFDPSEPFIERVQMQSGYQQYLANKAHFQHNVGV